MGLKSNYITRTFWIKKYRFSVFTISLKKKLKKTPNKSTQSVYDIRSKLEKRGEGTHTPNQFSMFSTIYLKSLICEENICLNLRD